MFIACTTIREYICTTMKPYRSTTIHVQIYTCVDVYICTADLGFLVESETSDLMDEQVVEPFMQDVNHGLCELGFETMYFDIVVCFRDQDRLDFSQGIGQVVRIDQPLLEQRLRTVDEAPVFLEGMDDGSVKDAWQFERDETGDKRLIIFFTSSFASATRTFPTSSRANDM